MASSSNVMIASDRCRGPGGRAHDQAELGLEEVVAGPDAAPLHVGAVVRADPGEVRGGRRLPQVDGQRGQRDHVRRAVGRAVPDVGEVHHRLVVVPVVPVHGVVARAGGALQVALPRLVRAVDQVADVARVDRVLRVLLRRVVQRDPERAAAGQGEVVPVARVLLGVELAEQAGTAEQAVQVRGLPGVAHDLAEVLVLEIEHEHVLVARHPGGRRGEQQARGPAPRRRSAGRRPWRGRTRPAARTGRCSW